MNAGFNRELPSRRKRPPSARRRSARAGRQGGAAMDGQLVHRAGRARSRRPRGRGCRSSSTKSRSTSSPSGAWATICSSAPRDYVPLKLALTVCVLPDYLRGHVEAAVLDALSNRVLPDGTLGLFPPRQPELRRRRLVSRILATAQSIPGVQNVMVTELERYEVAGDKN